MSKTYMEFVQELRSGLLEATGYAENRIYFKEKEEFPPTSGDRMIMKYYENEKLSEVCALHVRDLYELYQSGRTVEELVGEIMRRMEGLYDNSFIQRVGDLGDYGKIRGELFIRLLNVDRNKADLENAVYRRLGDIALVLYALLPLVRGVVVGLNQIPRDVLESARAMGMSGAQRFLHVQLPLALPVFLRSLRVVMVQTVGMAVIAALIGAGGFGALVFQGLLSSAIDLVLLGVIPVIVLAVLTDALFDLLIALLKVKRND